MKFLVAIGVFFLALVLKAPFFGALLLAGFGWGLVHLATRRNEEMKDAHRPFQATLHEPEPPHAKAQRIAQDEVPDGADGGQLRAYLRKLTYRIAALEQDLAALKGKPLAAAAPVSEPPAPAPAETARQEFERTNKEPEPPVAAVVFAPQPEPVLTPTPEPVVAPAPEPVVAAPAPAPVVAPTPTPAAEAPRETPKPRPQYQPYKWNRADAVSAEAPPAEPPPAEPPPAEPAQPEGPSFFARLVSGNLVAKVGAVVLFFGVGFLLKYAYDHSMISPQLRVVGIALAAIAVFLVGWKLRLGERRLYGLILEGVASGLAYLDVYSTLKFNIFAFVTVPVGFSLFAALSVATTMVAVRQDAKPLALLGLIGAFLAPVLAASGEGNYVFLFTYYLLLNLFILGVSWFKSWRALNLSGWFFTLAVAAIWGSQKYTPEMFGTIEPFLLAFFAIYLVIPILFATRQPPELKGLVDGTLVFGTPAAVAAIQAKLVWDMTYGLAWSAAIGAALYAVLSVMALRHQNMKLLGQTYVALALGLGTLAIFYAFGAYTTFALWSIEGAAIVWVCLRQNQRLGRLFGLAVQVAGSLYFALSYFDYPRGNPWFNDAVLGCAIIAAASFITAGLLRRYRESITQLEHVLGALILIWGAAWWSAGGIDAIFHGIETAQLRPAVYSLFFSASVLLAELAGARTQWPMLRGLTVLHPVVLAICGLLQSSFHSQPLADLGAIAWPVGLGSFFWVLHRQRRDAFDAAFAVRYASAWLILAWIATWQAVWHLQQHEYPYAMALAVLGYLAAALRLRLREQEAGATRLSTLPMLWATAFWFLGGLLWIQHDVVGPHQAAASILFVTAHALVVEFVGAGVGWPALRASSAVHPAMLLGAALLQFATADHPMADYGGLAWAAGLGSLFFVLHRQRRDGVDAALALRSGAGWLILIGIATWEELWRLQQHEYAYAMAIALAGYVAAGLRFRLREHGTDESRLSTWPMLWAMLFWFGAGLLWIDDAAPRAYQPAAVILFVTVNALIAELGGAALAWPALRASSAVHPVMLALAALLQLAWDTHPIADYGWLAWPVGLGGLFLTLHRQRRDGVGVALDLRYGAGWLILAGIATWEALWQLREREYLYVALIALAGYAVAAVRWRLSERGTERTRVSTLVFLWSMVLWFVTFAGWAHDALTESATMVHALLLCVALSAALYELGAQLLEWPVLRAAARLPWLAIPGALLLDAGLKAHPLSGAWGLAWPAAWLLALWGLRREERETVYFATGYRHLVALYAPIALLTWELVWRLGDWQFGEAWRNAAFAVPASAALLALIAARRADRWPLNRQWPLYRDALLPPLGVALAVWTLVVNARSPGALDPLSVYLPLANPIDIAIALAAAAAVQTVRCMKDDERQDDERQRSAWASLAVLAFVWLNAMALRAIHYWADVPYRFEDLARSVLVQATFSILWTSAALGLMLLARRRMERKFWIVGGALLAVVVGKLFLVDLANSGTVARIVSFLGVGVILLVIGYVAPVPPGATESEGKG